MRYFTHRIPKPDQYRFVMTNLKVLQERLGRARIAIIADSESLVVPALLWAASDDLSEVQAAWYGNFEERLNGNLEEPTFVVFNGRPDALVGDRAIGVLGPSVSTGETVRMFVGNIGPNLVSSFHVIGEIFDKVYVEGSFSLVNQYVQSTLVPAGGAVGVEFVVDVPGDYVIVDHSIFRVHKGALGVLHVEGEDRPDIYKSIEYSDTLRK
jgi:hypothetical protein